MARSKKIFSSALLLGLCTLSACSSGGPELAQVGGVVKVDGEPLAQGKIILVSEIGRQTIGKIIDGEIVNVTTFADGDGAVVGQNRVVIRATVDENLMMKEPTEAARRVRSVGIPEEFTSMKKTKLIVEIKSGEKNDIQVDIDTEQE